MHSAGHAASVETLSESKRAALLTLLADDDPAVYRAVRTRLLEYGPAICDWLRPLKLSPDPCLRRRVVELLTHHTRNAAHVRFLEFCQRAGESLDLEMGAGLMARTRFPEISLEGYAALLDEWAEDLRLNLAPLNECGRILGELNRYLFDHLGFAGLENYGLDPDGSYFNKVLDERVSGPIGLCLVYLLLARRLQLPIAGIGLPGHFVCRYQSSTREIYIDCFRRGAFLSKADCIKLIAHSQNESAGLGIDQGMAPVSNRRILLRMCVNLLNTCRRLEMEEEAARVQTYVQALGR